ncbi:unnamed protein product, partial [Sphacelaria rigidula]
MVRSRKNITLRDYLMIRDRRENARRRYNFDTELYFGTATFATPHRVVLLSETPRGARVGPYLLVYMLLIRIKQRFREIESRALIQSGFDNSRSLGHFFIPGVLFFASITSVYLHLHVDILR